MPLSNSSVHFEETPSRLKVVVPLRPDPWLVALYSALLVAWLAMVFIVVRFLVADAPPFLVGLFAVVWLLLWLWFGRFLWNRWQYHVANREILFIDKEQLILRRPVSILGLTTAYGMSHVSPFYFSEKHNSPAFDYAYQHVYFGQSLSEREAHDLVKTLNTRYFPEEAVGHV